MIDLNKNFKKQVLGVTCAIMAIAFVVSSGSKVLAQTSSAETAVSAPVVEERASLATIGTAKIKGTETWGDEHKISVPTFLKNMGKSTGIYKMFFETDEEKAAAAAQAEANEKVKEAADASAFAKDAPGWQSFLMLLVGFLIIYLGAGRGFEPLLLIPIGFGTVLVNVVGAGMGEAPDGMLSIIYNAGVGNESFRP